jgi:hypothetical protein
MLRDVQPQVIAAIVTAIAALLIALAQYFGQRKNSRELEEIKSSLDRQKTQAGELFKAYLNAVAEGRQREFDGYRSILLQSQELRDKLKSLLITPEAYSYEVVKPEIMALANAAVKAYAEGQLHLDESNWETAHSLKNQCLEISREFSSSMPSHTQLESQLARLTKLHSSLRDGAQSRSAAFIDSLRG